MCACAPCGESVAELKRGRVRPSESREHAARASEGERRRRERERQKIESNQAEQSGVLKWSAYGVRVRPRACNSTCVPFSLNSLGSIFSLRDPRLSRVRVCRAADRAPLTRARPRERAPSFEGASAHAWIAHATDPANPSTVLPPSPPCPAVARPLAAALFFSLARPSSPSHPLSFHARARAHSRISPRDRARLLASSSMHLRRARWRRRRYDARSTGVRFY